MCHLKKQYALMVTFYFFRVFNTRFVLFNTEIVLIILLTRFLTLNLGRIKRIVFIEDNPRKCISLYKQEFKAMNRITRDNGFIFRIVSHVFKCIILNFSSRP